MSSKRNVLIERLFTTLISGDRPASHRCIDEAIDADVSAEDILSELIWPTLEHVQTLHRNDQLSQLAYQYATRQIRQLVDHLQLRLERSEANGLRCLVVTGEEQSEEIAGQMAADFLEAAGYTVFYCGGGIANDEIIEELGKLKIDKLVIFGAVNTTVPATRLLIDHLQDIGCAPQLQVVVAGGIFNRADGLAEEIGADLWAHDPADLVEALATEPDRRMTEEQRTVGRKRPGSKAA